MRVPLKFVVNGKRREMEVDPSLPLVDLIREELDLTGTKKGCGTGDCGACTILLEGMPLNSCLVLAIEVDGLEITTIEGLKKETELHPIQEAFVSHGAIQCGFCTPGMVLSAKALLDKNVNPTERDVRLALSGNLCRCTGYQKIVEAILSLALPEGNPIQKNESQVNLTGARRHDVK
jgi:carbon-monoxide dehydrogenase small subunit